MINQHIYILCILKIIVYERMEDISMIEIRFHGRGGQGAVTAAEILAKAAFKDGKYEGEHLLWHLLELIQNLSI